MVGSLRNSLTSRRAAQSKSAIPQASRENPMPGGTTASDQPSLRPQDGDPASDGAVAYDVDLDAQEVLQFLFQADLVEQGRPSVEPGQEVEVASRQAVSSGDRAEDLHVEGDRKSTRLNSSH